MYAIYRGKKYKRKSILKKEVDFCSAERSQKILVLLIEWEIKGMLYNELIS